MKKEQKREACLECGTAMKHTTVDFRYRVARGWHVTLANTLVLVCPKCGERGTCIPKPNALERTIALQLVTKPAPLTGAELTFMRKCLKLSAKQMAARLRVAAETISRYESDRYVVPALADACVRSMVSLEYLAQGGETFTAIMDAPIKGERAPLKMTIYCDKSGTWRRAAA